MVDRVGPSGAFDTGGGCTDVVFGGSSAGFGSGLGSTFGGSGSGFGSPGGGFFLGSASAMAFRYARAYHHAKDLKTAETRYRTYLGLANMEPSNLDKARAAFHRNLGFCHRA